MARAINGTIDGPLILSLTDPLALAGSDDPLIITSTGTITSTGLADGIDGAAATAWTIFNNGVVSATAGWAIALAGAGFLYNSGVISGGYEGGVEIGGSGVVVNEGWINATGARPSDISIMIDDDGVVKNQGTIGRIGGGATGVQINGDAVVTNQGSIFGGANCVSIGGIGSVINQGFIGGNDLFGVSLMDGGSVTNLGTISGDHVAILGTASVTNFGMIWGGITGVDLKEGSITNIGTISSSVGSAVILDEGSVTNIGIMSAGGFEPSVILGDGEVVNQGSILGGVEVLAGGSGTLINQGLISHSLSQPGISVSFAPTTANNLLIIKPGAVFDGAAEATSGTNSAIELARGNGAISGIGEGQFDGFDTLKADFGANWTLNGANAVGTALNDGSLGVAGSLDVTTAVDPNSVGLFQLDGASTLEIAAALGISCKISFATGSDLLIDNFGLFGDNVGTSSYAGPLLEKFGGSTVDLKSFSIAGLDPSFSAPTGLLQLTNSASQAATLEFQTASLGAGTFHFISDGGSGVLITHS